MDDDPGVSPEMVVIPRGQLRCEHCGWVLERGADWPPDSFATGRSTRFATPKRKRNGLEHGLRQAEGFYCSEAHRDAADKGHRLNTGSDCPCLGRGDTA